MLSNITGAPGTTLGGAAAAGAAYLALSSMIPGQTGVIAGAVVAGILVLVGALAPTIAELMGKGRTGQ